MKIEFEEDRSNGYLMYFAISKMEIWKGKVHDELIWAELTPGMYEKDDKQFDGIEVVWEDDYYNPTIVNTMEQAKEHIMKNFYKHTPHINGASYNI